MQQTDSSRRRHVRHRFAIGGAGFAVVVAALVALAIPAAADTIPFTGQGTNADGSCETFEGQPPAPGGTQTWQFNLTGTDGPATMSATFSDGTTVTNIPSDDQTGNVAKWFIVTDAGASVVSASATRPETGGNPQFVVSHCTAGGVKPPPPTTPETTPTTAAAPKVTPTAPAPVVAAPVFTG
jgi:hypothetical protein